MSVADTEENHQDLDAREGVDSDAENSEPESSDLQRSNTKAAAPAESVECDGGPVASTSGDAPPSNGAPNGERPSDRGTLGGTDGGPPHEASPSQLATCDGAFVIEPLLAYAAIDAGAFCHDVLPSTVADTNDEPTGDSIAEVAVAEVEVAEPPADTLPNDQPDARPDASDADTLPAPTASEKTAPEETVQPESVGKPDMACDKRPADNVSHDIDDGDSDSATRKKPPLVSQDETDKIRAAAKVDRKRPKKAGFESLELRDEVLRAIRDEGYDTPSAIQRQTIPLVLSGSDLLGQAETGSGKTAAFACPLLSMIDIQLTRPQVLVLAPTRELAIQVTEAIRRYAAHLRGFRTVTIYGGQSYDGQLRELKRGVQIVVGTPGRVMDHMNRGTLKLHDLKCLVLDEADEMLRMGFIDDVEWILTKTPQERQILLFSATLPEPIRRIAQQHLKAPEQITVKGRNITADSIRQRYVVTTPREKSAMLTRILEAETTDGVIVFVKTRNQTVDIAEKLSDAGYSASHLNGDMPQSQRERTVENFRSGKLAILVATDVAARGLDVDRVSHVINFDFPHDVEAYVHRIGRTGRAGRSGNAILFVGHRERGRLGRIESATNQKLEMMHKPSIKAINENRVASFKDRIVAATKAKDLDFFTKLVTEVQAENDLPTEVIAAAIAKLAQGNVPLLMKEPPTRERNGRDREGRKDRPGRQNHRVPYGERGFKQRGSKEVEPGMQRYRMEVGRAHGVGPKNIVGALANESGIDSQSIGRIEIFDLHSTVDLPQGLDGNFFRAIKGVRVGGEPLRLTRDNEKRFHKSGPAAKGFGKHKLSNSDGRTASKKHKTKVKIKGKSKVGPGAKAKKRRVK